MNAAEFRNSIDALYERLKSLTETKGEEYKRREDNQFANFERGAASLGLTREQVLMVYLSKHLDSIVTYVKDRASGQAKVYAEPMTGRIDDAILYLLLLRGMVEENELAGHRGLAYLVVSNSDLPAPGDEPEADPRMKAFEQMTKSRGTVVISKDMAMARELCSARGLPVAVAALNTVDQLHGVHPDSMVVLLRTDDSREEDVFVNEVRERCHRQGLLLEVVPANWPFEARELPPA